MIVVPDAGPLIYLGGAGHLQLLRQLYAEVVVPRIVLEEVIVAGVGLAGADAVASATWLKVEDAAPDPDLLAYSTLARRPPSRSQLASTRRSSRTTPTPAPSPASVGFLSSGLSGCSSRRSDGASSPK